MALKAENKPSAAENLNKIMQIIDSKLEREAVELEKRMHDPAEAEMKKSLINTRDSTHHYMKWVKDPWHCNNLLNWKLEFKSGSLYINGTRFDTNLDGVSTVTYSSIRMDVKRTILGPWHVRIFKRMASENHKWVMETNMPNFDDSRDIEYQDLYLCR